MAALSDRLFLVTVLVDAVAMLAWAVDLAFRRREVPIIRLDAAPATTAAAPARQLVGAGAPVRDGHSLERPPSAVRAPAQADGDADRWGLAARAALVLTSLGWLVHLATIITRGLAAHRVPWGNMYEFSTVVAFVAVTSFLVLLVRERARWLGVFVMLPVVLYLGFAGVVLYARAAPLVPALNSYWLKIHVVAAISATGMFFVSGVAAILYLVKLRRPSGPLMSRLPTVERLDRVTYGVIALAFPIWTFAVIAGAIWAESAWGRYWGWDPKETWSFITWVIYAGYLHARATAGGKGKRAAWFAVAAFAALIINYYIVNLYIIGLHSYAGVK